MGYIDILKIEDWSLVKSIKISSDYYIRDIVKLRTKNEYALALAGF